MLRDIIFFICTIFESNLFFSLHEVQKYLNWKLHRMFVWVRVQLGLNIFLWQILSTTDLMVNSVLNCVVWSARLLVVPPDPLFTYCLLIKSCYSSRYMAIPNQGCIFFPPSQLGMAKSFGSGQWDVSGSYLWPSLDFDVKEKETTITLPPRPTSSPTCLSLGKVIVGADNKVSCHEVQSK